MSPVRTVLAILLACGMQVTAYAQGPAEASRTEAHDEARARELFERACELLEAGRFAEAERLLERSLSLHRAAPTAFNLALALRGLGRPIESVRLLAELAAGSYGTLSPRQRDEVERLRAEIAGEIAALEVVVRGPRAAEVALDDRPLGSVEGTEPRTFDVDPGRHRVQGTAGGFVPTQVLVDLPVGGRERIELHLELRPPPDPTPEIALWAAIGGGAVVAAIVIGALVAWLEPERVRDPYWGNPEP